MEKEELMTEENRHRIVICHRMASALELGEVYLDLAGHRMGWRIEKEGRPDKYFETLDEMEHYLEGLLENRCRVSKPVLHDSVRRRMDYLSAKKASQVSDRPILLRSKINSHEKML